MTKIVFFGDSITDCGRVWEGNGPGSHGYGYARIVANELVGTNPYEYEVVNKGISGNRITDLYARVKADVWNQQPDLLSVLVGVNDVWHEIQCGTGTEIGRFEKVYRALIEETKERFPNIKILLMEPFVTEGSATTPQMDRFLAVKEYAKVVKKLADEYGLFFLPLQEKMEACHEKFPEYCTSDGVHPHLAGAKVIADEWLKLFKEKMGV